MSVSGLGFRAQGLGSGLGGLDFKIWGTGIKVES